MRRARLSAARPDTSEKTVRVGSARARLSRVSRTDFCSQPAPLARAYASHTGAVNIGMCLASKGQSPIILFLRDLFCFNLKFCVRTLTDL